MLIEEFMDVADIIYNDSNSSEEILHGDNGTTFVIIKNLLMPNVIKKKIDSALLFYILHGLENIRYVAW